LEESRHISKQCKSFLRWHRILEIEDETGSVPRSFNEILAEEYAFGLIVARRE
jgi:hypothetical protein